MKKFKFIIEVVNSDTIYLKKETVCKGYCIGDGLLILDALNKSLLPGSSLTYKLLTL